MKLIIVESPSKGKTISGFLDKDYNVLASMGHVRDLPKTELGVDVENNFEPKYIIPTKAKKNVSLLKKAAKNAQEVILATDEDREGEAISWHLAEALGLKDAPRIVFHEITKEAIDEALKNPRKIDINLVNAQQARRILDRIVGYKLSPFLWKKVSKGLSAGRVQSVAVRLVVDKENEIKAFKPEEYWHIVALLKKTNNNQEFEARLIKDKENIIDKLDIKSKTQADEILANLNNAEYYIEKIEKKETKKNPFSPFTTSTLQQTSFNKLGYSAKMTMQLAQRLYEQGHITYHRTDSLNLSSLSLESAKKFIIEKFGQNYYNFRKFKAKGNAQEAHEAIRPTRANRNPESLVGIEPKQLKLYTLIWQRFMACQMACAVFDSVSCDIKANNYTFRANGQTLKFEGFLKVYKTKFEENELPDLKEKEKLNLVKIESSEHFTEPPARYNEASLIKALEKHGVGRPSTYAPTLSTIQERNYIAKNDQKKFFPTEMGIIVNTVLMENFPQIVDIDFTAKMEKELDEIAEGKDTWRKTLKDFYDPFAKNLAEKYKDVKKENTDIKTNKICIKCGKPMIEKLGRFGRFYACTGFPDCKHTESVAPIGQITEAINIKCPKCLTGNIVLKNTKRRKIFFGCDNYPKCDFATWDKPINEFCPKCKSILVEKTPRQTQGENNKQVTCSNKECDFKK